MGGGESVSLILTLNTAYIYAYVRWHVSDFYTRHVIITSTVSHAHVYTYTQVHVALRNAVYIHCIHVYCHRKKAGTIPCTIHTLEFTGMRRLENVVYTSRSVIHTHNV